MALFEMVRVTSSFDNFLELQNRRTDNDDEGFSAPDRKRVITKIRRNIRARRQVAMDAYAAYEVALTNDEAYSENGDIMSFLEWLIANQETIFALIQRIISLFGL